MKTMAQPFKYNGSAVQQTANSDRADQGLSHRHLGLINQPLSGSSLPDVQSLSQLNIRTDSSRHGLEVAHLWWRHYWPSKARQQAQSLISEVYASGHPRHDVFKRFASAEKMIVWFCTSGINLSDVAEPDLHYFLQRIYPVRRDFKDTSTVADLVEFASVFDCLSDLSVPAGQRCIGAFDQSLIVDIIARRTSNKFRSSNSLPSATQTTRVWVRTTGSRESRLSRKSFSWVQNR